MFSRKYSFTLLLFALTFSSNKSAADIIYWGIIAECDQAEKETVLKINSNNGLPENLYGCGGSCAGPHLVAEDVKWTEESCSCTCMKSQKTVACGHTDECPEDDYAKCDTYAHTTIPFACNELGYSAFCTVAECAKDESEYYPSHSTCIGITFPKEIDRSMQKCINIEGGDEQATGGGQLSPAYQQSAAAKEGGCSISTNTANCGVFGVLLLALLFSMFLTRRARD